MTGYRFDKYRYTALIPIALLATCMMVAGYILLDTDRPEYFRLYYLMPFSYGFILVVLLKWHQALMKSWSLTLISALYFIRYVVAPFLTCIGRYETLLGNKACLEYMDLAILLSVYEIFCVALVMWFF